jgi:hypothetical protein
MIHMQIPPPHPLLLRHLQENRMRPPSKIPRLPRKPLEQPAQLPHIALKLRWRGPANLLIHLRHSLNSVGPRQRQTQRRPLHEPAPKRARLRSQRLLPHHPAKRIAQMAHHPMRRHLPPPSRAIHSHPPQPLGNLPPILHILQRLLHPKLPYHQAPTIVIKWHRLQSVPPANFSKPHPRNKKSLH